MSQEPTSPVLGIHHVTAIASDPQANHDFYAATLGLRLVKKTVNFDDPSAYHFYFGDSAGRPGTLLTFFPWPGARRGVAGAGQVAATTFAVPEGALGFWAERLAARGVDVDAGARPDGDVLKFADPDGLRLELVERESFGEWQPWERGSVAARHAVRGVDGVRLAEGDPESTADFLAGAMGFRSEDPADGPRRFVAGANPVGGRVDVAPASSQAFGRIAAGSVHHVAFRLADDAAQAAWGSRLAAAGVSATPVKDRCYFRSIYFREPGGVLFELATDGPGFAIDEAPEALGAELRLPAFLEDARERIERNLPPIDTGAARGTP